ncbi:winged helix-turn-helix transcriptional regulator [Sulfolobus tengchongensis]|uniref:Winged helix-turn-helix transcriptional regulator n=1 Tax=Sulfolobus tengchongensis TaxID=207809 RepID=A0AAX4L5P5_9CREN
MDSVDKGILKILLKDARTPQRRIAMMLGISPPAVSYRMEKLFGDVIKRFTLYVNPNFLGRYHAYVAFSNLNEWDGDYIAKIECLEDVNIYEIDAKNRIEIEEKVNKMSEKLGEPKMLYIPSQMPYSPSKFDMKIISILKEKPLIKPIELAEELGVSSKTIRRHLRYLYSKRFIRLIPIIDLNKAEISIFAIFTSKVEDARKFFSKYTFTEIEDEKAGIFVNVVDSIDEAKDLSLKFKREYDKDAEIMITTKYEFI